MHQLRTHQRNQQQRSINTALCEHSTWIAEQSTAASLTLDDGAEHDDERSSDERDSEHDGELSDDSDDDTASEQAAKP